MGKKLRARFSNGVLTPLEKLDLEEGAEVTVSIDDEPELSLEERIKGSQSAAGDRDDKHDQEELKPTLRSPRLSTREWLEKARRRKEASPKRITAAEILEMRDADRT